MYSKLVCINAGGKKFQTSLQTLLTFPNTRFASLFSFMVTSSEDTVQKKEVSSFNQVGSKGCTLPPHGSAYKQKCSTALVGHSGVDTNENCRPLVLSDRTSRELFLDVSPRVFERVLNFLRTKTLFLPIDDLALRGDLVFQLREWELLDKAFPPTRLENAMNFSTNNSDSNSSNPFNLANKEEQIRDLDSSISLAFPLPDVCTVQLLDSMSVDAGVRRHALTITFGSDGFQLKELTKQIRGDLRNLLSATYWQVHQTGERSVFFATTRVADGAAAMLTTSVLQQVVTHTETMGYVLTSSSSTISPDPVHVSVRLFLQQLVFRRSRLHLLEPSDMADEEERRALLRSYGEQKAEGLASLEEEEVEETFSNFEPRHVGPKKTIWSPYNGAGTEVSDTPRIPSEHDRCHDFFGSTNERTETT